MHESKQDRPKTILSTHPPSSSHPRDEFHRVSGSRYSAVPRILQSSGLEPGEMGRGMSCTQYNALLLEAEDLPPLDAPPFEALDALPLSMLDEYNGQVNLCWPEATPAAAATAALLATVGTRCSGGIGIDEPAALAPVAPPPWTIPGIRFSMQ